MTLTELMDNITSQTDQEPNENLYHALNCYVPTLTAQAESQGFPFAAVAGMLSGIASVLQGIAENGMPSGLQEIMHGEKVTE